jgi:hypothetical protein
MTTTHPNLNLLAEKIKSDIDRRSKGHAEWIDATLDLCVHLAEARAAFTDNISFGKWFNAQGIKLNEHDRAAAIVMGQDPIRARDVLTATDSRSLQRICRHEFRLVSANKTTPGPVPKPVNEKRERAFAAYDRRKAAGEDLTWAAVQAEAGVSGTVARAIFTVRETEDKVKAETAPAVEAEAEAATRFNLIEELKDEMMAYLSKLTTAERKRHDARAEAFKWERESKIAADAGYKIRKWEEETGIAFYMKRLDDIERMLKSWPYSVMRKTEYNTIMRCLHPDTAHSRTSEERAEAFRMFTHYKMKMINDEEERITARRELRSGMPKTLAEMDARKKTKTV